MIKDQYVIFSRIALGKPIRTSVNGETVWCANRWKNISIKIKHFYYTSKNIRRSEYYLAKKVDGKYFCEIKFNNSDINNIL